MQRSDDGQGWPYAVKDTTAGMQEVERIRTNIGHIRVKMSGTNFPDRVEESENGDVQDVRSEKASRQLLGLCS